MGILFHEEDKYFLKNMPSLKHINLDKFFKDIITLKILKHNWKTFIFSSSQAMVIFLLYATCNTNTFTKFPQ